MPNPMHKPGRGNATIAVAAILAGPVFVAVADPIPVASVIVFNTECARCHEGECSGRMSFHLGEDAADGHIRRHGGDLPLEAVRQLGELLRYMKEQCAFYPIPLTLTRDRVWDRDVLDQLRSPSGTAYFLPLGSLGPGLHHLWIDGFDPGASVCADLMAADFDLVEHQGIAQAGSRRVLPFRVAAPAELHLRIRAQGPIALTRVELITGGTDRE